MPTFAQWHRSVKKTCRWHVFSVGRSGYAARRALQSPARRRNLPRRGAAKFPTVAAQRFPAPVRGRQSCRCLESGSLAPPPAARRRFPPGRDCRKNQARALKARTRGQLQRPPALRRACSARRAGQTVHVRAKGVLRTAGSKLTFAHFCSATKVGSRRQKSLGMANAKNGTRAGARNRSGYAARRALPWAAGGKKAPALANAIKGARAGAGHAPSKASALANAKTAPARPVPKKGGPGLPPGPLSGA